MVAFSERSLFYQVGVLLLLLAIVVFSVGLALPWWVQTYSKSRHGITSHSGLWLICSVNSETSEEHCSFINAPGWLKAVQGMQGVGLVGMLIACVHAIIFNFCVDRVRSSRVVEILAAAGGLLGIISATLYVTKISQKLKHTHGISYSWAFSIDIAASILVLFIAAIIAITNRPHDTASKFDDKEALKVVIEDAEGHVSKETRSGSLEKVTQSRSPVKQARSSSPEEVTRSRSTEKGGRAGLEVERSPARTRRLEAISEMSLSLEENDNEDGCSQFSVSLVSSIGNVSNS